jgi:mannitol-specific phosphotransferase system IIBC component
MHKFCRPLRPYIHLKGSAVPNLLNGAKCPKLSRVLPQGVMQCIFIDPKARSGQSLVFLYKSKSGGGGKIARFFWFIFDNATPLSPNAI